MADDDPDRDEEWFKEVYGKEYVGPISNARSNDTKIKSSKRPSDNTNSAESDEDRGPRDPNAVPTDFTSREAKVWEAKAKAIERNWKRRKEEELHCKICGEAGHFAQGCPTTLGGNRKAGEVVEKFHLKDKRLKPRLIGTGGSVIQGIQKDTGCRLRLEDNHGGGGFVVRITGPDKITVTKALNIVKKIVGHVQDEWKNQSTKRASNNRNANVNPLIAAQMEHIQRLQQTGGGGVQSLATPAEFILQDDERVIGSPADDANANANASYFQEQSCRDEACERTLEELEQQLMQETFELGNEQAAEEERENLRHKESVRNIQDKYERKLANLRAKHARQREQHQLHHQQHHLDQHHHYHQQQQQQHQQQPQALMRPAHCC